MKKLRVCTRAIPSHLSRGIHRVANALERYAPDWVEIVQDPDEADVQVVHVIGHGSLEGAEKRDIAVIQYCLQTTEDARPEAWLPTWTRARVVWSYYDLFEYMKQRNVPYEEASAMKFYYAGLGVDMDVFQPSMPLRKTYLMGTSGYIADTEAVGECYRAVSRLERRLLHLGPAELNLGPGVTYMLGVPDEVLADVWSQCSFIAGLRRIEGFELPAVEGLACGARPVMFDAPHYRRWFGEHAEYVPEVGPDELVEHLVELMSKPVRPVTPAERSLVAQTFDWKTIVTRFWEAMR